MFANSFRNRVLLKAACAVLLPLCMVRGALRPTAASTASAAPAPMELPQQWQGRPVRPLALSAVEQRFAARFPGQLSRLTDGDQTVVLRTVHRPTRMLHPAADCYRGIGWQVAAQQLEMQEGALWRCFEAQQGGRRIRVCERIVDANGAGFTDASAWYWAALTGQSTGPWQAVTVARPL
jgi:hypothetical protein